MRICSSIEMVLKLGLGEGVNSTMLESVPELAGLGGVVDLKRRRTLGFLSIYRITLDSLSASLTEARRMVPSLFWNERRIARTCCSFRYLLSIPHSEKCFLYILVLDPIVSATSYLGT